MNIKHAQQRTGYFSLCGVSSPFWLWNALQPKKHGNKKLFTCGDLILLKLGSKLFCFPHRSSNFDVDLDLIMYKKKK